MPQNTGVKRRPDGPLGPIADFTFFMVVGDQKTPVRLFTPLRTALWQEGHGLLSLVKSVAHFIMFL